MKHRSLLQKLNMIFPKREQLSFVGLFFLLLVGTVFDFFSVSLILPLVNLLIDPTRMAQASWYRLLQRLIPAQDANGLMLALVLIVIGLYLVKNIYAVFLSILQSTFMARN